jgi:hypothetical protein
LRLVSQVTLFCAVLAVGYAVHADYGVPWDEPVHRDYAVAVTRYVLRGDARLFDHPIRVYGPAHEVLLLAAEKVQNARDPQEIPAARHLVNFGVFVIGLVFLYRLALASTHSHIVSAGTCAALVASPVIFAHAFYNSKDIPFMAVFIAAMYTLLRLVEAPTPTRVAAHALTSAWLIAIRVPGILVPALTLALVAYAVLRAKERRRVLLVSLLVYAIGTAGLTYAFWPVLWRNPVGSFLHSLETMSRYPWTQDVLYAGQFVHATELPWHYAPVWIGITTPLLYLLAFVGGVPIVVQRAVREFTGPTSARGIHAVALLAWLLLPLVSVVALGSVLYDGWRQLFFVYPALLLIAAEGVHGLVEALRTRWSRRQVRAAAAALGLASAVAAAGIVQFMVRAHPHQQVFFNTLVGGLPGARFHYEMDYWGLSYRQGLEAILRLDRSERITVAIDDQPGAWNARALPYPDRRRLVLVDKPEEAKYFIGTYRLRRQEYPYREVVHREVVDGVPILSVAVLHPELSTSPDSTPGVLATRSRNQRRMGSVSDADAATELLAILRSALSRFVRPATAIELEMPEAAPETIREGRIASLRVSVADAEVGDFRFGRIGVPVRRLDVMLKGLVVDIAGLESGQFRPVRLDEAVVSDVVLRQHDVNRALKDQNRNRTVQVGFRRGAIDVADEGSGLEATIRVAVVPDPWKPDSENLGLAVSNLRLNDWPLPIAALLQATVVRAVSPLLDPDRIETRLSLGALSVSDGELRLGTAAR